MSIEFPNKKVFLVAVTGDPIHLTFKSQLEKIFSSIKLHNFSQENNHYCGE